MSISLDFKDDPHYLMSVDYIQTSVDRSVWIMSKDDVIFHKSELGNRSNILSTGRHLVGEISSKDFTCYCIVFKIRVLVLLQ